MTGRACFTLIVMTRFALRASLTCALQFHGAGISQELSRASERDFIKVPLRKTSPPGACFRRGRTGGLLCADDSNDVQTHRGVVSAGEPALTHQRPRLLTFTSALVRAISVSASVSASAPINVDGNAFSSDLLSTVEHLLHQTGPGNKHVVHFTVQAMSQTCKRIQRDSAVGLGMLQFADSLCRHAQTLTQRFRTHAQGQPNRLCPTTSGRGIPLQLRKIAKLPVKFG